MISDEIFAGTVTWLLVGVVSGLVALLGVAMVALWIAVNPNG
jgi:hypothetical protein